MNEETNRIIEFKADNTTTYVAERDVVGALEQYGYTVIAESDLPEVSVVNGKPKLPAKIGEQPYIGSRPKVEAFYEEALSKLALARWHEAEEARLERQRQALADDLRVAALTLKLGFDGGAAHLVARGWRRD